MPNQILPVCCLPRYLETLLAQSCVCNSNFMWVSGSVTIQFSTLNLLFHTWGRWLQMWLCMQIKVLVEQFSRGIPLLTAGNLGCDPVDWKGDTINSICNLIKLPKSAALKSPIAMQELTTSEVALTVIVKIEVIVDGGHDELVDWLIDELAEDWNNDPNRPLLPSGLNKLKNKRCRIGTNRLCPTSVSYLFKQQSTFHFSLDMNMN